MKARPCGCFGIGRHRNSCPEKILTSGGTMSAMEQAKPSTATAPAPSVAPLCQSAQQVIYNENRDALNASYDRYVAETSPASEPATVRLAGYTPIAESISYQPQVAQVSEAPRFVDPAPPPIVPTVPTWYGLPCMPDEELENYGGDVAAHESWSPKSRRPMATVRSAIGAVRAQPDLNYKGLLVNRHDPSKLFHFAYIKEDGSDSFQVAFQVCQQRGFRPVTPADFYVHSSLRGLLIPDDGTANGRLSLGGALKGGATVIYAQPKSEYDRWRAYDRRFSDQIQLTADEQAARTQEALASDGFAGILATATFE